MPIVVRLCHKCHCSQSSLPSHRRIESVMHSTQPLQPLQTGRWFKLICGASYQHIPAIRDLTIAYTLAGADCIDVAADPAIIAATRSAIAEAQSLITTAQNKGFQPNPHPWLMVSLNDGEDPHFRKAEFDPDRCPTDSARPANPSVPLMRSCLIPPISV